MILSITQVRFAKQPLSLHSCILYACGQSRMCCTIYIQQPSLDAFLVPDMDRTQCMTNYEPKCNALKCFKQDIICINIVLFLNWLILDI